MLCKERLKSVDAVRPVVLSARGLHKSFGGNIVLDGIDLELYQGEVVLLRGANGSGKTTLLNIISGALEPDFGSITLNTNGKMLSVRFPSPWLQRLLPEGPFSVESFAAAGVGRCWQDVRLFSSLTLSDNIAVATPGHIGENPLSVLLRPRASRRVEAQAVEVAQKALLRQGLGGRESSSADRVSLGQAKRVALEQRVRAGARVLLLDEPLAGLDEAGIAEVLATLRRLVDEDQVTLVLVEHVLNIPKISSLANTVWTIENGQLQTQENCETDPLSIEKKLHSEDLTSWLMSVAGSSRQLLHQELPHGASLLKAVPLEYPRDAHTIEVREVVAQRGRRVVLGQLGPNSDSSGISFTLRQGELALLLAPNGWGKTTLLEVIAGSLRPTAGSICLNGQDLKGIPEWRRRHLGISLLQSRAHYFTGLSVRESLKISDVTERCMDISALLSKRVSELSGGERQKLAICCALGKQGFSVALLDEPFSALDGDSVMALKQQLVRKLEECAVLLAMPGRGPDIKELAANSSKQTER